MIINNDMINGLFELAGALFLSWNCVQLYHDKTVKGVSVWSTLYFCTWGFWNLIFYYPSLGQHWSFAGAAAIVTANAVWVAMTAYYFRLDKEKQRIIDNTAVLK